MARIGDLSKPLDSKQIIYRGAISSSPLGKCGWLDKLIGIVVYKTSKEKFGDLVMIFAFKIRMAK